MYGRDRVRAKGSASGPAIWSVRFFALKGWAQREDGMIWTEQYCSVKVQRGSLEVKLGGFQGKRSGK